MAEVVVRPGRSPGWLVKLSVAVLGPLFCLLALEAGLRLFGFGESRTFFVKDEDGDVYRTNPHFTASYFPASFGLKPTNFRLTKAKPAGVHRVFLIGESAAMGVPEPGFGLARHLQVQLRNGVDERPVEVYNLAVTAINSHVIRRIVDEALDFQPDLLVVYMGNNEFVGPFGLGSALTSRPLPLPMIRAVSWLGSTRTGQLLQWLAQQVGGRARGADWRGMEMFGRHTVPSAHPGVDEVYHNFERNLRDLVGQARGAGVEVVLSTMVVNLADNPPFATEPFDPADETTREEYAWHQRRLELALARIDRAVAEEHLRALLALHPQDAEAQFRLGRLWLENGQIAAARAAFVAARNLDTLRFRADDRINEVIRRVAGEAGDGVALVDAALMLGAEKESSAPPVGDGLLFEHVHFRWEGNAALARAIAPAALDALGAEAREHRPLLDDSAVAAALGYTPLAELMMSVRIDELTQRPPFTGRYDYARMRTEQRQAVRRLHEQLQSPEVRATFVQKVEQALARHPEDPFLLSHAAAVHLQTGDARRALELCERLARQQPFSAEQAAQHAYALQRAGRLSEAETLLRRSVQLEPYYFQTYEILLALWAQQGRREEALAFLDELTQQMPANVVVRVLQAQLLFSVQRFDETEAALRRVLESAPDHDQALALLTERLESTGREGEAIDLRLRAYAYNPKNFTNNSRLQQQFEQQGDLGRTAEFLQAMAASGPVAVELHYDLAQALYRLGRRHEALVAAWTAYHDARKENRAALADRAAALVRVVEDEEANSPAPSKGS